ncbi:MAG TPA: flagellar assembly protein FliW [Armatimonadota bacterium]|nr:flagellar assembly protein FliW [Armatimonadota bacterium]
MKVQTTRFGDIDVDDAQVITLASGLLGFEAVTEYCLIPHAPASPFRWLQAVAVPELAFVVINPYDFFADYDIAVPAADAGRLGLHDPHDVAVLTLVTIREREMTTNLVGPIVVNMRARLAAQVVLADSPYSVRHALVRAA